MIPGARSFHHEDCSLAGAVEIVDDVHAAIGHIHQQGGKVSLIVSVLSMLLPSVLDKRKH